jgi:hypothetical protein
MNQALYAHMNNKRKKNQFLYFTSRFLAVLGFCFFFLFKKFSCMSIFISLCYIIFVLFLFLFIVCILKISPFCLGRLSDLLDVRSSTLISSANNVTGVTESTQIYSK